MFRNAIVRLPGPSIVNGLTSGSQGKPDYNTALKQHLGYVEALNKTGLSVTILEEDDLYPDSTFIEDVALCAPGFAVITSPGAMTRRGETRNIKKVLQGFYSTIEEISLPGTLVSPNAPTLQEQHN
jgi:dimethylargininase